MITIYAEVLYHYYAIYLNSMPKTFRNQSGQTLVEFILLLSILMLTGLVFLSTVNNGIAHLWQKTAKILAEDPAVRIILR